MPRVVWALLCTLLIAGCASNPEDRPELTEADQYRQAHKSLEKNNFQTAIDDLKELEARFPYGEYAEQAQLDLIYANYQSVDYPATVVAAQRFIRNYPGHPRVDYALYMRGLANFNMEKGLFDNMVTSDKSSRDLQSARDAFQDFKRLVSRFPDSPYAPDARSRMVHIRNQLARQELHVARYYARRGAIIASINRAQYVVKHYEQTPAVPEALAIMAKGYERLGRPELAEKSRQVLALNWPDSPFLGKDQQIRLAWWPNEDNGLLSLLTFDLL
ncbi:competence lipoprotein ComL [Alcanivorax hongdengensis A-11-3]|uniref:Outer membrane protein assembly factor BamD n=1 Tax=Alcanivorax hongdengensis A-11-3 TaxID=1177179 RepID=L0WFB7_9GAMM|nr:outer membrane protein assembly factor BamD [Alcanivorax hongdengensis]EKF74500.1 competence lipoprotein ComL [Alcanivorax hongdengensis A-11-3]